MVGDKDVMQQSLVMLRPFMGKDFVQYVFWTPIDSFSLTVDQTKYSLLSKKRFDLVLKKLL